MRPRYNLVRIMREIAEDTTIQQPPNEHLSQAEINRLVKARLRSVPPRDEPPAQEAK